MSRDGHRDGMTTGDALLVLATLALVFSLAYPRMERVAMLAVADEAYWAVDAVRSAAAEFHAAGEVWPDAAALGEVPPQLVPHLPADFSFQSGGFSLKWSRWERVKEPSPEEIREAPELPPGAETTPPQLAPDTVPLATPEVVPLAGITVACDDDRILASLLDAFGADRSFIRGSTWTLILEPAAENQGEGS